MLSRFEKFRYEVWRLPSWAKWSIVIWLVLSVDAVRMAWGEHRFVGGYFEALVADFIYIGIPLLAFLFGIFGGIKVYERTNSKIGGWAFGIATFLAIGYLRILAQDIPGVGWRIQVMQEAHDFAEDLND